MNIAMEQTEEYVDGQLKAKYGDCFLRGNNGKRKTLKSAFFSHYANCYTFLHFFKHVTLISIAFGME